MKKYLLFGALGVGGWLVYKYMKAKSLQSPVSLTPMSVNNNLMGQPSAQYPYKAASSPRVDNSNQPWYTQSRAMITPTSLGSQVDQNFLANVSYLKGTADITSSLTDIWGNLSDLFGTQSDPNPIQDNVEVADNQDIVAGDSSLDWGNLAWS